MIIAGMEKEDLVVLKFSLKEAEDDLTWKHSKEFRYMDSMYDIVDTEINGDSVIYWCWPDQKENELNLKIEKLVSNALGQNPQARENHTRYFNFLNSLYPQLVREWDSFALKMERELDTPYLRYYKSLGITPLSPPPKIG